MKINKRMMDRIRQKPYSILKIITAIIILASVILIGTPIKYNCFKLNIAIIIIGLMVVIYNSIKKKDVAINKLDIAILILYISPIIPLIFNTYSSLEETLISLIKNISLFNMYFIAKQVVAQKGENESFLTNTIILGGIILVVFGIDELTAKILYRHIDLLNIPNIINAEHRMFSTIGYANTFAIIMAIEIFLCFEKLKLTKYFFSGLIFVFLSALWLSYSRSVLVMFFIIYTIYMFFSKREGRVYQLYILIINLILAVLYAKVFEIFLAKEQYIVIWISTVFTMILSIVISKLISVKYKKIKEIRLRTYILIAIFIGILICILYVVGISLDRPLMLFASEENNNTVRRDIRNVETNREYSFIFDIDAKSRFINSENYSIEIDEENKYYDTIKTHQISFNNYEGEKEIKFTTTDETVKMVIYFKSSKKVAQQGLIINSLSINGVNKPLNYLYLPIKLVEKIESFNVKDKSVCERLVYYKDSIKIIKDNFIFGTGGRGWLYNNEDVQSYTYGAVEVHSYPIQIFIENGIVAIVAFVIILIYIVMIFIKKRRNISLIDGAFIILTLHSFIDFNLSFYFIITIWTILLAIVGQQNNPDKENKTIGRKTLLTIIIVINILGLVCGKYAFNVKEYNECLLSDIKEAKNQEKYDNEIELIKRYSENEVYEDLYKSLGAIDYGKISEENIEYIYETIINKKIVANTYTNIRRRDVIIDVIKEVENEEIASKFAHIIIDENNQMIENIKDKDKNRLTDDDYIKRMLEEQESDYNLALEVIEKIKL